MIKVVENFSGQVITYIVLINILIDLYLLIHDVLEENIMH